MSKTACGILVRSQDKYLLCHATRPSRRVSMDDVCWSISKGMQEAGEALEATALREFKEETGCDLAALGFKIQHFGEYKTKKKHIQVFFCDDPQGLLRTVKFSCSSFVEREDGKVDPFLPEIDAYYWASISEARAMVYESQMHLFQKEPQAV